MSRTTPRQVIESQRARRRELISLAERFVDSLDPALDIQEVVVFGSVARGDCHETSDVDVLVIAKNLPDRALQRNAALGIPPPRVEFVAWTPEELHRERQRGNPITEEIDKCGHWLYGAAG